MPIGWLSGVNLRDRKYSVGTQSGFTCSKYFAGRIDARSSFSLGYNTRVDLTVPAQVLCVARGHGTAGRDGVAGCSGAQSPNCSSPVRRLHSSQRVNFKLVVHALFILFAGAGYARDSAKVVAQCLSHILRKFSLLEPG